MYAGLGYGLIDESRSVAFKNEEWDTEDILVGVLDQMIAAAAFNRGGSTYEREMIQKDPYEYIMTSLIPPGGLVQATMQDVSAIANNLFTDKPKKDVDNLAKKVPLLGDFYKYYIDKEERADG